MLDGWPTPLASDSDKGDRQEDGKRGIAIGQRVKEWALGTWPTPTARDGKDGNCIDADVPTNALLGRAAPRWAASTHGDLLTRAGMTRESVGPLSPLFAEWVMGWPIGHTGLEPLGMESIRWPLLWRLRFLEAVGGCGRYEPSEDL